MKSVLLGVVAVTLIASANGCRDLIAPDQSVMLYVGELDVPTSVPSGTRIVAVVTFNTAGCLGFDHLETRKDVSGASITVWGRDGSIGNEDVLCPQVISTESRTITFDPPFAGSFTISVTRPRDPPLTATVEIL